MGTNGDPRAACVSYERGTLAQKGVIKYLSVERRFAQAERGGASATFKRFETLQNSHDWNPVTTFPFVR